MSSVEFPQGYTAWCLEQLPTDECVMWPGAISDLGYGQHKLVWKRFHGSLPPKGYDLDHLCRNRACVNPAHLEPVTHRENILRGDTFLARQAAQTHCIKGHPLSGDNLYLRPEGHRECRICRREAMDRWRSEHQWAVPSNFFLKGALVRSPTRSSWKS